MKKRVLGAVIIMICLVMLFSACNLSDNVEVPDISDKEATYTVTFLNYDNSLLHRATDIKEGEPAIYAGETPTRPDSNEYTYSFIGWDKDISAIYSNLSVFAKYSETSKTGGNANTDEDAQIGHDGVVLSASILSDNLYLYQPNTKVTEDTPYDLLYSCRDNDNYYYGFDLGTVRNVIVDDNSYSIRYMGPANIKRTYVTSKVSSTSIENQSSWLEQRLEYDDKIAGWSAEAEVGVFELFSAKASVSNQYYSNTTTTTNSSGETVKQEVTVTESQSIEITFDSTCPYGEYRISHVMDYDVFVIATKAIKTGEITLKLMTLPRKGIIELYEYSDNGFTDIKLPELDFDSSIINDLPVPTDNINSGDETPPQIDYGDTTHYAGGHGTEISPYLIANVIHLKNIVLHTGSYFKLIDDIDCGGTWTPVTSFSGTIDGHNHTISNISCVNTVITTATSYGFITILNAGASIQNLTFENITITADYSGKNANGNYEDRDVSLGCVVAINRGTIKGVNVYSSTAKIDSVGSTSGDNAKRYYASVGGICGRNYATIENCYVGNVTVLARSHITKGVGYAFAGGIVGYLADGATMSNVSVSGCHIDSYVHSTSSSKGKLVSCAGGMVGAWIGNANINATPSDVIDTYILADYDGSAYPRERYYYGNNGGSYIYGYKGANFTY
ncbi:MAG: hypothetical protein K2K80_06750 [Clostridia bacterium]|nr:hypothetical protein [Clostridia bacterium]